MKRSEAQAIKTAPGRSRVWVLETETRDVIVAGTDRDKTTLAYIAIGAESWGPLFAAAPELVAALRGMVTLHEQRELVRGTSYDDVRVTVARVALAKVQA